MKKIFVSFDVDDRFARDDLVHQAQKHGAPFEFLDIPVKNPWDFSWKAKCHERIKGCHGVIALVSDNTFDAGGARWEIQCAYEERVPVLLLYVDGHGASRIPPELRGKKIYHRTWNNVKQFIDRL